MFVPSYDHSVYNIIYEPFLHNKCRRSDLEKKQHQLQTGDGPPIIIDDDEDMHEKVHSIVPTTDFTIKKSMG